jgi:hypothetical protein
MNLTQSTVFAAPPYNFSPCDVGFVSFAFVAGGIFGVLTAGPFSDWVAKKFTVRNNYIREAEMRMLAMSPPFAVMVLGYVVIELGYRYHSPWQAICQIGLDQGGIHVVEG